MKYTISDMRISETREVEVTGFFPKAEGRVVMRIRRLTNEKRNEVLALTVRGQIRREDGSIEIKDTSWLTKARTIQLLHGVDAKAEDFPFERWDEQTIKEIDERNPEFITVLSDAIQEFNSPLAERSGEKSATSPE